MSLPREWSLNHEEVLQQQQQQQQRHNFYNQHHEYEGKLQHRAIDERTVAVANPAANCIIQASSQETVGGPTVIADENMNQHVNPLLGSLFSIHSAPVYDVCNAEINSPPKSAGHYHHHHHHHHHHLHEYRRPTSLQVQTTASSSPIVPPAGHLSPPETLIADDEDNENLLTISSLTARPLIAKSRELGKPAQHRSSTATEASARRRLRRIKKACKRRRRRRHKRHNFEPLDGGYGWVVVFGAFFVQFWVAGLVKSYGLLYVEVMETFTDSSASVASWIPAILSCLCLALAPVTSMLSQKYSCRVVVFVGGLFCSLGLIISFFATSLIHLLFTFGVLTGIGGGLSTTPGIILVSQYFDKHRALANGICVSGTAAGSFVFPMLIEYLVTNFGFHGTLLILGGCMLHVCASASLYRPLEMNYPISSMEPAELEPKLDLTIDAQQEERQQQPCTAVKRQQLEMLFVHDETTKNNMLNELFHQNQAHVNELAIELTDSEEEKDIMGEAISSMKPISKIRSSSILHSVEDLSTDSTCFYKSRSSQRSLRSSALAVCPATAAGTHSGASDATAPPNHQQPATHYVICSLTAEQSASKESLPQRLTRYIDLSLLRDTRFIMMCLSVTLMSTGSPYMLYYLPAYVNAQSYSKSEAGYLVAISAALDLCGRLGLGWLSDLQLFDRRKGYIGSIVGAGVAVLIIPLAHSFYVLACSVGMYGLCLGCWFLLVPVLLADQYGTDKISSSYGLVRMFQSIGAITIPPLAGFMRDVTGSYNVCFLFMGSCMVLGGIPLLIVSDDSTAAAAINSNDKKLPEPDAITVTTSKTDCKDITDVCSKN